MRWKDYIDTDEVKKAINVLQDPAGVFEVRAIGTARKDILSGYFRDAEALLRELDSVDMRQRNVYVTLGKVKDECFARAQSETFLKSPQTTSDTEIIKYRWLFVDLDPVRSAGISSSDQELAEAEQLTETVYQYMLGLGFHEPVRALSGNGCHLLYRIDVDNNEEGRSLIERCLKVLADLFNNDKVKIDTTNSNPSRICKLHGTLAQKGRSTKDRPHRMSRIVSVPNPVMITPIGVLRSLSAELPEEPQKDHKRINYPVSSRFDLIDFMQRNRMTYKEDFNDRATIYKLDECPFDPSHKDGDAKIFLYKDGAIAFKCHHNSCKQYKWQDVRLKYEPDAYDYDSSNDERIDAGYRQHLEAKKAQEAETPPKEQKPKKQHKVRKLKTAEALMQKNLPEPRVFVGVGEDLPLLLEGTCILSAKPKVGKSWFALGMCIAIANGEDFIGYKTTKCSTLYLDLETSEVLQQKRLKKVLHGAPVPKNFYLETDTDQLENGFIEQIEAYLAEDPQIGVVVIDVFQIIRSQAKSYKESEYEHAYRDITPLNELAQKHHISIILVCHDRKAVDPDDPFSNILGSTGLQGAATQMMVMFRKKKEDPIHISVKGKTIDGLPELNVQINDAEWSIVEGVDTAERELIALNNEYLSSDIRKAVVEIANHNSYWKGRCSAIINDAIEYGVAVEQQPKAIGGFLHRHQARFFTTDQVKIKIIDNGTGPKIYEITKTTIDTIDENEWVTIDDPEKAHNYGEYEIPFL